MDDDSQPSPNKSKTDEEISASNKLIRRIVSPFISQSSEEVAKYDQYLGKAGQVEPKKSGFFSVDPMNFFVGSTWGVISGYTSGTFFTPVPDKFKLFRWVGTFSKIGIIKLLATRNWLYPTFVAFRISKRMMFSGLMFDQTERRVSDIFGVSKIYSSLAGFTVLSIFFKLSTNLRDAAIASSVAFGGYLIGNQFAHAIDHYKTANRNRNQDSRTNGDNDK